MEEISYMYLICHFQNLFCPQLQGKQSHIYVDWARCFFLQIFPLLLLNRRRRSAATFQSQDILKMAIISQGYMVEMVYWIWDIIYQWILAIATLWWDLSNLNNKLTHHSWKIRGLNLMKFSINRLQNLLCLCSTRKHS